MNVKSMVAAAALAVMAPASFAAVVTTTSNNAPCSTGVRVFSVMTANAASCLLTGSGNINGNNQGDAGLLAAGWLFLDASDTNGGLHDGWLTGGLTGGLSGSFSVNAAAYASYDRIAIGFKSGAGQVGPDWAIFELADFTNSGNWSISGAQALSHAILYGIGTPSGGGNPNALPEPGSLALVAVALIGGALTRRAKR